MRYRSTKDLMEAVYAAGCLTLRAEDADTKGLAARLQLLGFVTIEEVGADGTARRLKASEAQRAETSRPWRVIKPVFQTGDTDGLFASSSI